MDADLPRGVLADVFRRLDFEDRYVAVRLVCKAWRDAATDAACWAVVDVEECFRARLRPLGNPEFEDKIDAMVKNVVDWSRGTLVELHLRHCSDAAVVYVASKCPGLRSLSIKDCPSLTHVAFAAIAAFCTELKELDVSGSTELSALSIGRVVNSLTSLKKNYPIYRGHFEIRDVRSGSELCMAVGEKLESLELRNCILSDEDLRAVVRNCPELRHLDLRGCQGLSNAAVGAASAVVPSMLRPPPNFDEGSRATYGHWQLYNQRDFLF